MIGKSVLHYKVIEKLGEGGMGVVYLAEDSKLKRQVAIKFLPQHIAANSDERKRFEVEAQAAAALNHPNIATIHAIEETENELFIVMEYIAGRHLKHYMDSKPLPAAEAMAIAAQIARGLQAAHKKGIIHRDIKSANIMRTEDGQIKIMDFGLAKFRGSAQVTQIGTTIGTAAYMSPEQANGENVDQRSDLWSFGVVLYEMLNGTMPFRGDYEQAVIYSILNEEPATPKGDIPKDLWQLIKKLLNKNPGQRYASADAVLDALDSISGKEKKASTFGKPVTMISLTVFLAVMAWWFYNNSRINEARNTFLPQIEKHAEDVTHYDNGLKAWSVFKLARKAAEIIPQDSSLLAQYPSFSDKMFVLSDPPGADVYAKAAADTGQSWTYFGKTPLDSIWFPEGYSQIKLEKKGFRTVYDIIWNAFFINDTMSFILKPPSEIPDDMVLVPQISNIYEFDAAPAGLHMPGLEHLPIPEVGSFFIDKYEVTNRQFKKFMDDGGYKNHEWWGLLKSHDHLNFEKTLASFKDKTDQPGPATWEVGDYPGGQEDYPVSGISLYEAAAYAEYTGKNLPTIYHWDRAALTWASSLIVPLSNIASEAVVVTGSTHGINRFGVYDMAGNVREWCINKSSRGGHFILGGGWDDPIYSFNDSYAQPALDRSRTNGFRCIKYYQGEDAHAALEAEVKMPFRDFLKEKQIDDQTFRIFLKQYAYDKTPLNTVVEKEEENELWYMQKVSFDAAYGNERMAALLFLPQKSVHPFQTVIFFPGSGAIHNRSSDSVKPGARTEFIIKSGRAFVWPIYKSTYERGDGLKSDYPDQTNTWKEHVIMWTKDFSRTIDYLETRTDIDKERLIYYGASWG